MCFRTLLYSPAKFPRLASRSYLHPRICGCRGKHMRGALKYKASILCLVSCCLKNRGFSQAPSSNDRNFGQDTCSQDMHAPSAHESGPAYEVRIHVFLRESINSGQVFRKSNFIAEFLEKIYLSDCKLPDSNLCQCFSGFALRFLVESLVLLLYCQKTFSYPNPIPD